MQEPTRKYDNELWTVEKGDCPIEHEVDSTFTDRDDAVKYRDKLNRQTRSQDYYIGTIRHNPS